MYRAACIFSIKSSARAYVILIGSFVTSKYRCGKHVALTMYRRQRRFAWIYLHRRAHPEIHYCNYETRAERRIITRSRWHTRSPLTDKSSATRIYSDCGLRQAIKSATDRSAFLLLSSLFFRRLSVEISIESVARDSFIFLAARSPFCLLPLWSTLYPLDYRTSPCHIHLLGGRVASWFSGARLGDKSSRSDNIDTLCE